MFSTLYEAQTEIKARLKHIERGERSPPTAHSYRHGYKSQTYIHACYTRLEALHFFNNNLIIIKSQKACECRHVSCALTCAMSKEYVNMLIFLLS